ncbi:17623_t:CDS:2, partial [Funneliformis geosporum]
MSENNGYSYNNNRGPPYPPQLEQGYPQEQYYPPHQQYPHQQQYPQQPPRQPSPQQYSRQPTPPRQLTPPQQLSTSRQPSPSRQEAFPANHPYRDDENNRSNESLSHVQKDGWVFRPPENGHVITKGEMISRIVQYYEMFVVNVFLLGYNVLKYAKLGVDDSTVKNFLMDACGDRFHIEQFDYCSASRLFWGLIGGAIIYFIFTSIVAFALSIELRRRGYDSSFTALWHSPAFLLCFFYDEEKRVDILSIPNKYVGLSLWTRSQIHRISLAIYCAISSVLILVSLKKGTAETAKIEGEGLNRGLQK